VADNAVLAVEPKAMLDKLRIVEWRYLEAAGVEAHGALLQQLQSTLNDWRVRTQGSQIVHAGHDKSP
jgi:hypothetical protein